MKVVRWFGGIRARFQAASHKAWLYSGNSLLMSFFLSFKQFLVRLVHFWSNTSLTFKLLTSCFRFLSQRLVKCLCLKNLLENHVRQFCITRKNLSFYHTFLGWRWSSAGHTLWKCFLPDNNLSVWSSTIKFQKHVQIETPPPKVATICRQR